MISAKNTNNIKQAPSRQAYPTDVTDAEWAFAVRYLTLMLPSAPQRKYPPREIFNALRWMVRAGASWRLIPHDLPPWKIVYDQTQRWIKAGCFVAMAHDLRMILRLAEGRKAQPSAAIYDAQTLQGTIESGHRAGYDGHKKKNGSKAHAAVDTLGHLLALLVTPANERVHTLVNQDRDQVAELTRQVQEATGDSVEVAFVDQAYTGAEAEAAARERGVELQIVKLSEAKNGFVLLPRRWVVERSFSWKSRFRRLVRDYERLPETVAGLHFVVFVCLMLAKASRHLLS